MSRPYWKVIRPPKLNDKAMRDEMAKGMKTAQDKLKKEYQKTTRTWEHKVAFQAEQKTSATQMSVSVWTEDEIYGYVDKGTRPHAIFAGIYSGKSTKRVLAFPGTFTAKTVPGVIDSRRGGSGGGTVLRPYVQHPGTEARNFSEIIERDFADLFALIMGEALSKAAVKSYHGISKL